jgi:hypothetical protein
MAKEITIGITRKPSTDEYRVFWKEGKKDIESKAYYTDDALDAVNTLESIRNSSPEVEVSTAKVTQNLIQKYGVSEGIEPYDMSHRQAQEFHRESRECRETPHMKRMREYGVG